MPIGQRAVQRLGRPVNAVQVALFGVLVVSGLKVVSEILRFIPTEEVRLTFKAPERAATVEPEGWADPATYLCLVMPLRLLD